LKGAIGGSPSSAESAIRQCLQKASQGGKLQLNTKFGKRTMKPHPFEKAHQLLKKGEFPAAVEEARRVHRLFSGPSADSALAGILVDVANFTRNLKLAREGKALMERLPQKLIDAYPADYHYNLGNAFSSIGYHQKSRGAARRPAIAEAVSHYDQALQFADRPNTRANLANSLLAQGRYIEALDELDSLLASQPRHYNAFGYRGASFLGIDIWLNHTHGGMRQAALHSYRRAVELAKDDPVVARHFAPYVHDLESRVSPLPNLKQKPMRSDVQWIWSNRLALNPCPICMVDSPDAFDLFPLSGVLTAPRRRPPTKDLFVVLNAILGTFGTARWQLWSAESPESVLPLDHIIQHSGSGGTLVDLRIGLKMSAFSGFYRVLGQIASALNNCLALKHPPEKVTFNNVWGKPRVREFARTVGELNSGVRRRNSDPLSALYYLAASLERGLGRYQHLRILRNHIEHRLAAPFPKTTKSRTPYYEPFAVADLSRDVYVIGRLARAAIWYLCAVFSVEERRRVQVARREGHVIGGGTRTPVTRR
jgi:tetratricopeptide (TPR) repeat protein